MALCLSRHLNSASGDTKDVLLSNFHGAGLLHPPAWAGPAQGMCTRAPLQPSSEATAHCLMALLAWNCFLLKQQTIPVNLL